MVDYQYVTQVFVMAMMLACYIVIFGNLLVEELKFGNKWIDLLFLTGIFILSMLLLYGAGTFSLILGVPYDSNSN